MHQEKKITREDTWKTDELRKHIRGGGREEDRGRRREEYERQHRGAESLERRPRDPEREARKERDKQRDDRKNREKDRHLDRRKERSDDRIGDREEREKGRRRETDIGADSSRYQDGDREKRDRIHYRGEKENRDREKERTREGGKEKDTTKDRERERHRDREKEAEERERHRDRDKEGEERERERRREERERRRENESNDIRKYKDKQEEGSRRDGHKDREHLKESEHRDKRKDRERRERYSDKEHTVRKEDKEYREHRRKEKEEKERRHRQRPPADVAESRRHDGDPREGAHKERKSSEDRHRADREGAERDRLRERRRREEDDPKREEPTERSRDKRSHQDSREKRDVKTKEVLGQSESLWKSSHKELSDTEEPVEKQEHLTECQHDDDGDAPDYEEDFEDYEEDFEEGSESNGEEEEQQTPSQEEEREEREEKEELSPQTRKQIAAIQSAMKEENDRIGSSQTRMNMEEEEEEEDTPSRTRGSETRPQQGKFIDFVAAKHREVNKKVTCQQKKRSVELLRLIDLDYSITFSLLDLPPVNEYDMYIKSFGTTNTKQAYVQCNEDNSDRGVQTEELESSEMWTQHPAEWNAVCGGPNLAQEDSPSSSKMNVDSQHLVSFLRSASQVVAVLLEEGRAEKQSLKKLRTQEDTVQSFSEGCLQLNTKLPFLHGRPISLLHFSQTQTQTMLTVHSPTEKPSAVRLDSNTILCVWNIWEPSRPQKILLYESEVRSCCLSPGKATLVFAGTSVGSVVLWDLREPAGDHYTLSIGDMDWTLRHPTFSTDAVLAASGHLSSVSSVEAVPAAVSQSWVPEHPLLASDEESSGLSFQLASLDENGVLNLWVVLELPKPNDAGSQTDLGLRPGGKVKLLHSSTLLTSERKTTRDAVKTSPPQALLIKFLPSDPSHFFIGTNMGLVNHGTNHGLKAPPRFYRPALVGARPVDVTCIDFSPFEGTLFLVGCGDGSVRLHAVASERPVLEWSGSTAGVPVVSVQWAQTRPAVFCVLDATSTLHMWDLLERDSEPVVTEHSEADRVTAMAAFGDPSKQNMFSGIALARQSGKIEMQYFSKRFTVPDSADLVKLQTLKDEAFLD